MLKRNANPLLSKRVDAAVDLSNLKSPTVHRRPRSAKLEIRDARRAESAADAIGAIDHDCEIYGFTKGQFSVIDVILHALQFTGPAQLEICTWTAANKEITNILALVDSGQLRSARWLVDVTFNRRAPELAQRIRQVFGPDAIRVAKTHAKFALIGNDAWQLVIRTSMNLNHNPRFENFQIGHDPALYAFHAAILDEVWRKQPRTLADSASFPELERHFQRDL